MFSDRMLLRLLPLGAWWVGRIARRHGALARGPLELGFERLPKYFSPELLARARVVPADPVPMPPLARLAMRFMAQGAIVEPAGITYNNVYFVAPELMNDESLHFHELIHVIQWEALGLEAFLLAYLKGYLEHGYENCPLEEMAYRHQARYESGGPAYDAEAEVRKEIAARIRPSISRWL